VDSFWILYNEERRELYRSLSFVAMTELWRLRETISKNEKKIGGFC
jgi:hypothetical protein